MLSISFRLKKIITTITNSHTNSYKNFYTADFTKNQL